MHVRFLLLRALRGRAAPHLQPPRLEVRAVGARHQLAKRLARREPRFQVVLLRRRVVELAGDDVHDVVRDAQALVEVLRVFEQTLHLLPARVAVAVHRDELLHLLELVHAEDAERVAPVRPGFLAEAGGVPGEAHGQVLGLHPLLAQVRAARLLGRRDEVLVLALAGNLVQLLVEVRELRALRHAILAHEKRRGQRRVPALRQERQRVVDHRLVQQDARAFQVVPAPARDVRAALGVRDVQHRDQIHVVGKVLFHALVFEAERAVHDVVLLVVAHRNRVVHDVPDLVQTRVRRGLGLLLRLDQHGNLRLDRGHLLDGLLRVLARALQRGNRLVRLVELGVGLVELPPRVAPLGIQRYDVIHVLHALVAATLRLADELLRFVRTTGYAMVNVGSGGLARSRRKRRGAHRVKRALRAAAISRSLGGGARVVRGGVEENAPGRRPYRRGTG